MCPARQRSADPSAYQCSATGANQQRSAPNVSEQHIASSTAQQRNQDSSLSRVKSTERIIETTVTMGPTQPRKPVTFQPSSDRPVYKRKEAEQRTLNSYRSRSATAGQLLVPGDKPEYVLQGGLSKSRSCGDVLMMVKEQNKINLSLSGVGGEHVNEYE